MSIDNISVNALQYVCAYVYVYNTQQNVYKRFVCMLCVCNLKNDVPNHKSYFAVVNCLHELNLGTVILKSNFLFLEILQIRQGLL